MSRRIRTNYSPDVLALNPELSADDAPRSRSASPAQEQLDEQLSVAGLLLDSEAEYPFDAERKWRFDRAWPSRRIAAEIDGGNHLVRRTRSGRYVAVGRHTQSGDYTKLNAAVAAGWRVYRFTPEMVKSGEAFATLQDALTPLPFAE